MASHSMIIDIIPKNRILLQSVSERLIDIYRNGEISKENDRYRSVGRWKIDRWTNYKVRFRNGGEEK